MTQLKAGRMRLAKRTIKEKLLGKSALIIKLSEKLTPKQNKKKIENTYQQQALLKDKKPKCELFCDMCFSGRCGFFAAARTKQCFDYSQLNY